MVQVSVLNLYSLNQNKNDTKDQCLDKQIKTPTFLVVTIDTRLSFLVVTIVKFVN